MTQPIAMVVAPLADDLLQPLTTHFELVRWSALADIVNRLNTELRAVLESPEFRKPLELQGYEVLSSTPAEFESLLAREFVAMAATVKQAGIQLD